MSPTALAIAVAAFAAWWALGKATSKRLGFRTEGPIFLIPIARGDISRWFRRRRVAAVLSSLRILVLLFALVSVAILVLNAYLSLRYRVSVGVREVLAIPGINPYIPITFGIFSLAVAISLHELSHGVMMEREGLGVSEVGILLIIFPLGAYVEPRERVEESRGKAPEKVFAAGPGANLLIAAVSLAALLVMASGIAPAASGYSIAKVVPYSELYFSGAAPGSEILEVDGKDPSEYLAGNITLDPRLNHTMLLRLPDGATKEVGFHGGLVIEKVIHGYPAEEAGLREGDVILEVNGHPAGGLGDLRLRENGTNHITIFRPRTGQYLGVELGTRGGKIGVYLVLWGAYIVDPEEIASLFSPRNILPFTSLPLRGMEPPPAWIRAVVRPPIGGWTLFNAMYWLYWMDLALGLTNALPIYPLDGGNMVYFRLRRWAESRGFPDPDSFSRKVVGTVSLLSLALLMVPLLVGVLK